MSRPFIADGPIRIVPPLEDRGFVVRDDCGLLALIRTPGDSPPHFAERTKNLEAFARLVAAAPDLLHAIRQCIEVVDAGDSISAEEYHEAFANARSVIAMAEPPKPSWRAKPCGCVTPKFCAQCA